MVIPNNKPQKSYASAISQHPIQHGHNKDDEWDTGTNNGETNYPQPHDNFESPTMIIPETQLDKNQADQERIPFLVSSPKPPGQQN